MLNRNLRDASFNIKWINKLIEEEEQAIELYKEAISDCTDEHILNVYTHILQEEIEHVEELTELKEEITKPVEDKAYVKDSKGVRYVVVVNGERYATFDNEYDAYQCENNFYNMDEDTEAYYGSYPDVRIIKEDANGRRIKDANMKKVKYGKPTEKATITYSVEGSEEGEIFDNLKSVSEARAKIRDLKRNDKEMDIDQDYTIYKHYITEDSDYIEEV